MAIPPLLVKPVWMCLSIMSVVGRPRLLKQYVLPALYIHFPLIKLSFGSQSYLIVLTQHINLKYIFQCPRSRMGEESVPQGKILLLTSEEVPLVPTVKGCLVKVLTLNLHPVLLQP